MILLILFNCVYFCDMKQTFIFTSIYYLLVVFLFGCKSRENQPDRPKNSLRFLENHIYYFTSHSSSKFTKSFPINIKKPYLHVYSINFVSLFTVNFLTKICSTKKKYSFLCFVQFQPLVRL